MSTILGNVTLLVEEAIDWVTAFVGAITATDNALLLLFVVTGFVGLGVGLIKRIIKL